MRQIMHYLLGAYGWALAVVFAAWARSKVVIWVLHASTVSRRSKPPRESTSLTGLKVGQSVEGKENV
jgi:hypothetical protein